MVFVKACAVGILGAMLAIVVWLLVMILDVLPLRASDAGVGAISISISGGTALLLALAGFSVGFAWTVRRGRRHAR